MTEEETNELLRLREEKTAARRHGTSTGERRRVGSGEASIGEPAAEIDAETDSNDLKAHGQSVGGIKPRTWMVFSLIGGLIYGYNVSMAAPLQYIRDDLNLTSSQEEVVSATATLSDASSMLIGGYLADTFGRKTTAMFACSCSIFGALMASLFSVDFGWLVFWRLCSGVGNGLSILLLPMYISECVDAEHRGTYLTLYQLGVNSGTAIPYFFMIFVSENWRSCLAFGSFPALYVFYNFYFSFPESISWLQWKQDPEKYDLENGSHNDSKHKQRQRVPSTPSAPSDEPLRSKPRLELVIGILLAYVNNCIDASLFYGPEIISKVLGDSSNREANIFGLTCALLAAVSVVVGVKFLINSLPRRQLYLFCLIIVTLTFVVSGIIFAKYSTEDFANDAVASTSIIVTFVIMNIFAAIGTSMLFIVILSELFTDNSYRARYMSYCTFAMSFISLLVNGTLLTLFEKLGTSMTFFGYGSTYAACLVFFWVYLPETKQREIV
ncbi:hypothetical protein Poli38472_008886 [Pythium oligandrum]|uniref:Major facilitator superfamily (MFS) profile domain-containing protein n=1 Tax=Pythium oligandrum TaxID=41045 RepID=A0A8K1C4F5_PYTOL|nr:hypothetical protein Poli38472_008886 [Pythium oligandrum]|eukprot:TMW56238.1 hypothetical protein Poli38472_008886 [Pythium oligandrum]